MLKKVLIIFVGLFIGVVTGYFISKNTSFFLTGNNDAPVKNISPLAKEKNQVVGFLPFWLVDNADKDYAKYITTLSYFGLIVDTDGTILKYTKPGEQEPGWYTLQSGKVNDFFETAKKNNLLLSLLVFNADEEKIGQLISDPSLHAKNLIDEVAPIMQEYGFDDLNLDIESVLPASDEARQNFTRFVKEVRKNMDKELLGTLTIDASPIVLVKDYLINLKEVEKYVDRVVLMTYDFHYQGSYVTGPVAPIGGVDTEAEYDSETSIKEALKIMQPEKILLGAPLYGYEWETVGEVPRSAVIPQTGIVASNRRVEELIKSCPDCTVKTDRLAKESYLTYKDQNTGSFHQIFYPDEKATLEKIALTKQYDLGGMAFWALGYEGETILNPLKEYKQTIE